MQKSKTHFEQVPVETVKKIAQELPANDADLPEAVSTDQHASESRKEGWQEVARKVQQEQDPSKMIQLVDQLIAKFDEEHSRASRNIRSGDARVTQL